MATPASQIQTSAEIEHKDLNQAIARARERLVSLQQEHGNWCFELEADCTIPAEYILMLHYLGESRPELEAKIGVYLREHQAEHGGWPLYHDGDFNVSCSVKAYYALKLIGDDPDAPHMVRAREAILVAGGAARSNVFTRIALAMFGQVPWRAVPYLPVEIMLLPKWFPFHLSKVSYWSRTVMVPLLVLYCFKAQARNPHNVEVQELFTVPPEKERRYFPTGSLLNRLFLVLERTARLLIEPLIPTPLRQRALKKAEAWIVARRNGRDGLGAIFPAMVNACQALELLGYSRKHPYLADARAAIDDLLVIGPDSAYCQPCVSPVWDTGLASMSLLEDSPTQNRDALLRALNWLADRQLTDEPGDWRDNHADLAGGGWAFQFNNAHYPDLDDTAVVAWAMLRFNFPDRFHDAIHRAASWLIGMQSRNGGFAAFESDNAYYYLNEIPFADHGALLDPPTSDVTARCVGLLARLERSEDNEALQRALQFLRNTQETNGSWFGRWGTNYIYGTWSVLVALEAMPKLRTTSMIRRAAHWLKSVQHADGGWGEDNDSYLYAGRSCERDPSTSFQTALALLGLMAAGEIASDAVTRGVEFLLRRQGADDLWADPGFTAPGFPRVFYLKYHGYDKFFPLWALARYRNLKFGREDSADRAELDRVAQG